MSVAESNAMAVSRIPFGVLLLLVACDAATAETYRCESNGSVSYMDRPCLDAVRRVVREYSRPSVDAIDASRARLQSELSKYAMKSDDRHKNPPEASCCCNVTTSVSLTFEQK
jgi:hypothetical protein